MAVESEQELLECSDLVVVCTPTDTHADMIVRALDANVHVIVEKPIARDEEGITRVLSAASRSAARLAVAHSSRYLPSAQAVLEAVRAGRLGRVRELSFFRESQGPDPIQNHWQFDLARSGGILLDSMVHDIDLALAIGGPAESVDAQVEDRRAYARIVHFSGVVSTFAGSWRGVEPIPWLHARVHGDKADAEFVSLPAGQASIDGINCAVPALSQVEVFERQLADLIAAVRDGAEPAVTVDDAVNAARTALACLHAAAG